MGRVLELVSLKFPFFLSSSFGKKKNWLQASMPVSLSLTPKNMPQEIFLNSMFRMWIASNSSQRKWLNYVVFLKKYYFLPMKEKCKRRSQVERKLQATCWFSMGHQLLTGTDAKGMVAVVHDSWEPHLPLPLREGAGGVWHGHCVIHSIFSVCQWGV